MSRCWKTKRANKSATESKRHAVMDTGCVGGNTFMSYSPLEHVCSGPGSVSSSFGLRRSGGAWPLRWNGTLPSHQRVLVLLVVLVGVNHCCPVSWTLSSSSFNGGGFIFLFFFLQVSVPTHKSHLTVFMKLKVGCVVPGRNAHVRYHPIGAHPSDFSSHPDQQPALVP